MLARTRSDAPEKSRDHRGRLLYPMNAANWADGSVNAQSIKQGVRMPPNPLAPDELSALLGYLESLK